jgi:hypothetical protein
LRCAIYWHNRFGNDGGSFALNRHYPFLSALHPFSPSILSKVQYNGLIL